MMFIFRGQTRRRGEKIENFSGEPMESAWSAGPGVARGAGDHSIIYGADVGMNAEAEAVFYDKRVVYSDTLGIFTGQLDKNGVRIFTGDIVQYQNDFEFDCQAVVKFGEYGQDGSSGEYGPAPCLGFYVEVNNFTCPDWLDELPKYLWKQSILQVAGDCEVIGNIWDNPDLLSKKEANDR